MVYIKRSKPAFDGITLEPVDNQSKETSIQLVDLALVRDNCWFAA